MHHRALPRRTVLLGAVALAAAGCGSTPEAKAPPAPPDPEVTLLIDLVAGKTRLLDLYTAAQRAHTAFAERLRPFHARHAEHLKALTAELNRLAPEPSFPTPSPSPAVTAAPTPPVPAALGRALAMLRGEERKAAVTRLRHIGGVSPSLAQLLASIGACEAAHAVALPRSR
ncbi:hypothetical protein [Rhizohabitans arisaemae]|uniref:hypothetical protein n=1 Tax=Rhizohabitans arisaemae TaxID=2720610 RepID=UPI0024B16D90|nr:hypothetical protein [Rhizohabitans arisaemae]